MEELIALLLDTTFLIDLQREVAGAPSRGARSLTAIHAEATLWISFVTWMEFAEGFAAEKEDSCRAFLSRFPVVLPDVDLAWRAAQLSRDLRQRGSAVGDHDIWIAATALHRALPLVTRNPRHFGRIPGLQIVRY